MAKPDDLSRSLVPFEQSSTLVAVIEMSLSSWLVAGIVPGLDRHPLKKLGADEDALLRLLQRWRDKAVTAGGTITRVVVAFEAGRDGFWLARWLRERSKSVGIVMVTAASDTIDRVVGLETGADDYISKPFEPRELLARVRSVLRRMTGAPSERPRVVSLHLYGRMMSDFNIYDVEARTRRRINVAHNES